MSRQRLYPPCGCVVSFVGMTRHNAQWTDIPEQASRGDETWPANHLRAVREADQSLPTLNEDTFRVQEGQQPPTRAAVEDDLVLDQTIYCLSMTRRGSR